MTPRARVAVVGGGVSGLTAAYLLRRTHSVTLYEADDRIGGHAHTMTVDTDDAGPVGVDTGFIVHNRETYPNLIRLFEELGVATRPTEMSMSITCEGCGMTYAGGRGLRGIIASPRTVRSPAFLRLLATIPRFHRAARRLMREHGPADLTLGAWLEREGFGEHFVRHFVIPLVSCVWSSGNENALTYPARYLFEFLANHGMLRVTGSPRWFTVEGGSRSYVDAIVAALPDVRAGEAVRAVARHDGGVRVTTARGEEDYDHVVIATHADTALQILEDPSPQERELLSRFHYTSNAVVLHRDDSVLPDAREARASWNFRMDLCDASPDVPQVTYWMNRLQGLDTSEQFLVSLNAPAGIAASLRVAELAYDHPVYTPESVAAAEALRSFAAPRTTYAGAHLGWGFHEDGCRSGVEAARSLGAAW